MKLGALLKTWIFNKGECSRKGGRRRFAVWCFYNGYENLIESPKYVLLSVAMEPVNAECRYAECLGALYCYGNHCWIFLQTEL